MKDAPGNLALLADSLFDHGREHHRLGELGPAAICYERAERATADPTAIQICRMYLAMIYVELAGQAHLDNAADLLTEALEHFTATEPTNLLMREMACRCRGVLGLLAAGRGQLDVARELFQESYEGYRLLRDEAQGVENQDDLLKSMATQLMRTAGIHSWQENYELALQEYQRAMDCFLSLRLQARGLDVAVCHTNIARCHLDRREWVLAEQVSRKAIEELPDDPTGEISADAQLVLAEALWAKSMAETSGAPPPDEILRRAVPSLVALDRHRFSFGDVTSRAQWVERMQRHYRFVFAVADAAGDAALVCDLVDHLLHHGVYGTE